MPLAVGLVVALAPEQARACSCGRFGPPSLAECQSAGRVYAGTIEAVEFPFLFEPESDAVIRLKVDTVWRGDTPAGLLAYTGIECGGPVMPPPGTPFLACESGDGDGTWTAFSMCGYPRFDAAPEIREMLGPGRPPSTAPALRWQWWRVEQLAYPLVYTLALPGFAVMVGGVLGGRRRRAAGVVRVVRSPIRGLFLLAAIMLVARLGFQATLAEDDAGWWASHEHARLVALATVAIATLVGLWLGYRGQRWRERGGRWRGLGVACGGVLVLLFAGFVRLHVPLQPADVVACSEARAREFLRTAPSQHDFRADEDGEWDPSPATVAAREEALWIARDAVPRACADWGLRRMRFDPEQYRGPCVEFEDGIGGTYRRCVDSRGDRYREERPG